MKLFIHYKGKTETVDLGPHIKATSDCGCNDKEISPEGFGEVLPDEGQNTVKDEEHECSSECSCNQLKDSVYPEGGEALPGIGWHNNHPPANPPHPSKTPGNHPQVSVIAKYKTGIPGVKHHGANRVGGFNEKDHPRVPAGSAAGGQFTSASADRNGKQHWKEQPRVEAGKEEGGEWTSEEASGGTSSQNGISSKTKIKSNTTSEVSTPKPIALDGKIDYKEKSSIEHYRIGGYSKINKELRDVSKTGKISQETVSHMTNLDNVLKRSRLTQDITVYRGLNDKTIFENANKLVGKTLPLDSYQSTSTSIDVARSVCEINSENGNKYNVIVELNLKSGTNAIDMDEASSDDELPLDEILLGRLGKMKVNSAEKNGDTVTLKADYENKQSFYKKVVNKNG
jgi:hypothetical protein